MGCYVKQSLYHTVFFIPAHAGQCVANDDLPRFDEGKSQVEVSVLTRDQQQMCCWVYYCTLGPTSILLTRTNLYDQGIT